MLHDVRLLFRDLIDLSPAERERVFRERRVGAELRAEVESLLSFDSVQTNGVTNLVAGAAGELLWSMGVPDLGHCGPYRLVRMIGSGGMGMVCLAQRTDGEIQQQVAVKLLRHGHRPSWRDRFLRERQLLASLQHPSIVHVIDAGHTEDGRPFLVMEYVEGLTIDTYAAGIDVAGRLRLFLKVCEGVSHAHRRLIIHRDLKPSNIVVDTSGQPKLLDFGIARLLDETGDVTQTVERVLTPNYASPEQLAGTDQTTATDIYSLGAVLYKLLTGVSPRENAPDPEKVEIIPPSRVNPEVPKDVDFILRKALRKEPDERYVSVDEFATDVRAVLDWRPVQARSGDVWYRTRRFLRHFWLPVTAVILVLVSLSVGLYIANRERAIAERRFGEVRQLANKLFDIEHSIQNLPGNLEARKLVVSTARGYLERLSSESAGNPGLEREIAEAYERLADIQFDMRFGGEVIDSLRHAYEIRLSLGDDRSADAQRRAKFITTASTLASRYASLENTAEAAKWDEEAVRLAGQWATEEPLRLEALETACATFITQAFRLETAGHAAQARSVLEKAVQMGERASAIGSADHHTDSDLAAAERNLSNMLVNLKDATAALPHAQRALALTSKLREIDPSNRKWRRSHMLALGAAGPVYRALAATDPRQLPAAVAVQERAQSLAREMMLDDPKNARAIDDYIVQSQRLASALTDSGKYDQAAALYSETGVAADNLIKLNPQNRRNWYLLAKNQVGYGKMRLQQGHLEQARRLLFTADEPFARALALDPFDAMLLDGRAVQFEALAQVAHRAGDQHEAQHRIRQCLDVIREMVARDPSAKSYIDQEIITLAKRLGVSTEGLP